MSFSESNHFLPSIDTLLLSMLTLVLWLVLGLILRLVLRLVLGLVLWLLYHMIDILFGTTKSELIAKNTLILILR